MQKDFTVEKNDLLLMLLYSKGSTGNFNEPVRGVTRLMKLLFLINEQIKNPEKFNFEPYKMGPYSSDVYSAISFFNTFPSSGDPIIKIEKSADSAPDSDSVKFIMEALDDESSLEDGFGNNAKFYLTERGEKLARLVWTQANSDQQRIVESIKTKFAALPLRELLRYVYDSFPSMTTKSTILNSIYD